MESDQIVSFAEALAPHELPTHEEQMELAMRLASIVMLPRRSVFALNMAWGIEDLRRAHELMLAAKWDRYAAVLDQHVIGPAEKAHADRQIVDAAMAAGMFLDSKYVMIYGISKEALRHCKTAAISDKNGNAFQIYYWLDSQRSPWLIDGIRIYGQMMKLLGESRSHGQHAYVRREAETVWSKLTPDQRAAAIKTDYWHPFAMLPKAD